MSNQIIAQKYYNVARAMCRVCTTEHIEVRNITLTIDAQDHAALLSMAGEYPTIRNEDGKLSIFGVVLTTK